MTRPRTEPAAGRSPPPPMTSTRTEPATARAPRAQFKPVLVISRCLELEPCRYDGGIIRFDLVKALAPHVEYRPVCPEVEVGLGVPRDPIRLVASGGRTLLQQPSTGRDLTDEMEGFAGRFLGGLTGVDGFILKSRSPSCGPSSVKVFDSMEATGPVRRDAGLFASAVLQRHGDLAVEDEGRLRNRRIREHFLTKLFALARLREVGTAGRMARLVAFHAMYKFVLLGYGERALRHLGWTVANPDRAPFETVFADYRASSPPRRPVSRAVPLIWWKSALPLAAVASAGLRQGAGTGVARAWPTVTRSALPLARESESAPFTARTRISEGEPRPGAPGHRVAISRIEKTPAKPCSSARYRKLPPRLRSAGSPPFATPRTGPSSGPGSPDPSPTSPGTRCPSCGRDRRAPRPGRGSGGPRRCGPSRGRPGAAPCSPR